ncbi:MAG: O-antigen ligase [Devosia sp.]
MQPIAADRSDKGGLGHLVAGGLFLLVLAYYWMTLTPFPDLGRASAADPWGGNSNVLNQAVALSLLAALIVFALRHPLLRQIGQPRLLIAAIFGWFALTSMFADDPATALRRVVLSLVLVVSAAVFLLLPRNERQFAKLLAIGLGSLLALCYYGVLLKPMVSIHQTTDVGEPLLAGLWRGFYGHKNIAAPAMAFTVFAGLYVYARWSRLAGILLAVGALYFLARTGSKTSLAMVPATIIVAWAFERWRGLRVPIVVGGLSLFNFIAVGSAVWPGVAQFVDSLGIDASFTDRVAIWQLAFESIAQRPLTGFGFQSFWQTGELVYGGGLLETWAVTAANAHNAFLDTAINAGIPGLVLVVFWVIVRPLRDFGKAQTSGNDPVLSRLFLRIWLYGIFASSLESFFFVNAGPPWFTILLGMFGLGYQARVRLVAAAAVPVAAPPEAAHA